MYHELPAGASLWRLLLTIDQDLALTARQQGCSCGGRLHRADFPRQPRGQPDPLPGEYRRRFSFCCERQGPSPCRVRELSRRFGADRRTITRWQSFWREQFPPTQFWKVARGRFADAASVTAALPARLLEKFLHGPDPMDDWGRLPRFLSPITLPGALAIQQKRGSPPTRRRLFAVIGSLLSSPPAHGELKQAIARWRDPNPTDAEQSGCS